MFTGIITEMGRVAACVRERTGLRLGIDAPGTARGLPIGGSVSVDGVCLTAIEVHPEGFTVQVIPETSRRSTLRWERLHGRGHPLNLERPLAANGEVGGHFVQGHVDAIARVLGLRKSSQGTVLALQLPANLVGLVVAKGSIAVNGVSLTVASVEEGAGGSRRRRFDVALIPHTLERTNLGSLRAGDQVNLEADILGKYVQNQVKARR